MKTLVAVLTATLALGGGAGRSDRSEKEDIKKTLQFSGGGTPHQIVVDNISGSIDVVGYDGSDVQLVAHRTSHGTSEDRLRESKEKIRLDIREEPGKIILYVNTPWRTGDGSVSYHRREDDGFDADFDFELTVPSKTDFFLKTVNKGTITVSNMNGAFEVSNVNGGIDMSGITGGGLVSTVNGKVGVRFRKNPDSRCGFKTVNGSIEVEVPGELSADLKLKTFNGEVYSDFDVTGLPRQASAPERIGRRTVYRGNEFFSVRAGNGGPEMLFETLNGDIRILRTHN
ncbi:MAG TPA: hypothetical protein VF514_10410 [Bacteroidota bacterium]